MSIETQPTTSRLPLSAHLMYSGTDVDQARVALSRLFTPISLEPERGQSNLAAVVNGMELPNSAVTYLEFGSDCVAGPEVPLDFHTLQLTQSGNCTFKQGKTEVPGSSDRPALLTAGQFTRVRHSHDNGILCWIVKDEVLRDLISTWTGNTDFPALHFRQALDPLDTGAAMFLDVFHSFTTMLNRHGGAVDYPAVVASYEQTLLTAMLFGLGHNLADFIRRPALDAGAAVVRKVEAYLEHHAADPIDMPTVARETASSLSSIYRAFQRHRGYTPMEFLGDVRMRLARTRLLNAGPEDHVTAIALSCGFGHLGRFAGEYRRRFGESPKQTRDRVNR